MEIVEIDELDTVAPCSTVDHTTESNVFLWTGIDSWFGNDLFFSESLPEEQSQC